MCRQVPAAHGRYILSHDSTVSTKFLSDILSEHFPQYSFPAGEDTPSQRLVDNSKVSFLPFLLFKWQGHITIRLGDYGECSDASAIVHTSEMQMLYFVSWAHAGVASSA